MSLSEYESAVDDLCTSFYSRKAAMTDFNDMHARLFGELERTVVEPVDKKLLDSFRMHLRSLRRKKCTLKLEESVAENMKHCVECAEQEREREQEQRRIQSIEHKGNDMDTNKDDTLSGISPGPSSAHYLATNVAALRARKRKREHHEINLKFRPLYDIVSRQRYNTQNDLLSMSDWDHNSEYATGVVFRHELLKRLEYNMHEVLF